MDVNSLSHSKWNCKYHIVFAPKFRRKVAYGALRQDIANILSMLCKRKGVNIVEAEICPDHIHMLVEIPPNISVDWDFRVYNPDDLKDSDYAGQGRRFIQERYPDVKYTDFDYVLCKKCDTEQEALQLEKQIGEKYGLFYS